MYRYLVTNVVDVPKSAVYCYCSDTKESIVPEMAFMSGITEKFDLLVKLLMKLCMNNSFKNKISLSVKLYFCESNERLKISQ